MSVERGQSGRLDDAGGVDGAAGVEPVDGGGPTDGGSPGGAAPPPAASATQRPRSTGFQADLLASRFAFAPAPAPAAAPARAPAAPPGGMIGSAAKDVVGPALAAAPPRGDLPASSFVSARAQGAPSKPASTAAPAKTEDTRADDAAAAKEAKSLQADPNWKKLPAEVRAKLEQKVADAGAGAPEMAAKLKQAAKSDTVKELKGDGENDKLAAVLDVVARNPKAEVSNESLENIKGVIEDPGYEKLSKDEQTKVRSMIAKNPELAKDDSPLFKLLGDKSLGEDEKKTLLNKLAKDPSTASVDKTVAGRESGIEKLKSDPNWRTIPNDVQARIEEMIDKSRDPDAMAKEMQQLIGNKSVQDLAKKVVQTKGGRENEKAALDALVDIATSHPENVGKLKNNVDDVVKTLNAYNYKGDASPAVKDQIVEILSKNPELGKPLGSLLSDQEFRKLGDSDRAAKLEEIAKSPSVGAIAGEQAKLDTLSLGTKQSANYLLGLMEDVGDPDDNSPLTDQARREAVELLKRDPNGLMNEIRSRGSAQATKMFELLIRDTRMNRHDVSPRTEDMDDVTDILSHLSPANAGYFVRGITEAVGGAMKPEESVLAALGGGLEAKFGPVTFSPKGALDALAKNAKGHKDEQYMKLEQNLLNYVKDQKLGGVNGWDEDGKREFANGVEPGKTAEFDEVKARHDAQHAGAEGAEKKPGGGGEAEESKGAEKADKSKEKAKTEESKGTEKREKNEGKKPKAHGRP